MPEGHTLHRIAREHRRRFRNRQTRVESPQGRFADGAGELDGRLLRDVEAHGKHLLYRWSGGRTLHVHLGLYGKFRTHAATPLPPPRGAVRLRVETRDGGFDLNGPNRCALVEADAEEALRARLGDDPLRRDARPARARRRIRARRAPIGALLLDQSLIAGVGNIFRAEALFAEGIDPRRPGSDLSTGEVDRLWATLRRMLRDGVRLGRIVTVRPPRDARRAAGLSREDRVAIYGKAVCPRCDGPVVREVSAGRALDRCPRCQR